MKGICVVLFISLFTVAYTYQNISFLIRPDFNPVIQYFFIDKVHMGYNPAHLQRLHRNVYTPVKVPSDTSLTNSHLFRNIKAKDHVANRSLTGILNNRFASNANANLNTFRPIYNIVWPFVRNPDFRNGVINTFDSCDASNGQSGICMGASMCNSYGGTAGGACRVGSVCCVVQTTDCSGSIVKLNNTYFQTPSTNLANSACNLVITVNKYIPEQRQAICQVRLDLVNFVIAQPSGSQCVTDSFQASGALNTAPVICGDNDNQHMYLHVPPSDHTPTDLSLNFKFGPGSATRSWNIKITFIPCASSYKAPDYCLQYITSSSGKINSFNWRDVTPAIRQLANMDYRICFRTETVNNQRARKMCLNECSVTTAGNAFSISENKAGASQSGMCSTGSFVGFPGGFTIGTASEIVGRQTTTYIDPFRDRYCGLNFHPFTSETTKVTVCSTTEPFEIHYKTPAADTVNHMGFCLNFQQLAA